MDTRILLLLIAFVALAACKHASHHGKHHGRKNIARELLELRNKHQKHGGKGKHISEREETVMADLEALLADADSDTEDMQQRSESDDDDMNATEDEDERSDESTDELDERSEESDDLDLLALLAGRNI